MDPLHENYTAHNQQNKDNQLTMKLKIKTFPTVPTPKKQAGDQNKKWKKKVSVTSFMKSQYVDPIIFFRAEANRKKQPQPKKKIQKFRALV